MEFFLGIDPGKNGCIAVIDNVGHPQAWITFKDRTEHDIGNLLEQYGKCSAAVIERVSSSPQMGVVSAFTFGRYYGFVRGLLVAFYIPFREVSPAVWQKEMQCRTGGDKNISKAAAQKLWPSNKFTHANSDATLLAEFGRRTYQ